MGDIGDAYAMLAAMRPRKCICGEYPQGHPSGLCDACVAKRSAPAPERNPAAGWVEGADGQWRLRAGSIVAHVVPGTEGVWRGQVGASNGTDRASFVFAIVWEHSLAAAQLAAEDALKRIAAEILAALEHP